MNWRLAFVVLAAVLAVVALAGFTDWDPIKVLAVGLLSLCVASFVPSS